MNAHHQLLGLHLPTGSVLHRMPALTKMLGVSALILGAVLLRSVPASLGLLGSAVALLLVSRVPVRRAFGVAPTFWVMVLLVSTYGLLFGNPWEALITGATMVAALLMGRVITLTTPAMDLVDALVRLGRPLDWVGIGAERFGLAVMVVLRSVPYLFDSFNRVQESARARGLERHMLARITPVVIDAIAYANRTGEALIARGLGEAAEEGKVRGHD